MSKESRLDVFRPEGLFQKGIIPQVDLPHGQVIRSLPIALHLLKHLRRKRSVGRFDRSGRAAPVFDHGGELGIKYKHGKSFTYDSMMPRARVRLGVRIEAQGWPNDALTDKP